MLTLGIETTCDETAVAIIDDQQPFGKRILGHQLLSQIEEHLPFGGVVPELAARNHLQHLSSLLGKLFKQTGKDLSDLDGIGASAGPGLIGGVLIGSTFAKALAFSAQKPFVAINHLEAHALCIRLEKPITFPFLLLLISGGHCQILNAEGIGQYQLLGETIDDALGEAFDKVARLLQLPYPGGPEIEKSALKGNMDRFVLPHPLKGRKNCDFSFSGLKTAVRQLVMKLPKPLTEKDRQDVCASFQKTVGEILKDRLQQLPLQLRKIPLEKKPKDLVIAGGVSANKYLRNSLTESAQQMNLTAHFTSPPLCTDNGAMVAWATREYIQQNRHHPFDFRARPRWSLQDLNEA